MPDILCGVECYTLAACQILTKNLGDNICTPRALKRLWNFTFFLEKLFIQFWNFPPCWLLRSLMCKCIASSNWKLWSPTWPDQNYVFFTQRFSRQKIWNDLAHTPQRESKPLGLTLLLTSLTLRTTILNITQYFHINDLHNMKGSNSTLTTWQLESGGKFRTISGSILDKLRTSKLNRFGMFSTRYLV